MPVAQVTIDDAGTRTNKNKVPGGRVDVRIDNDIHVGANAYHGFSMGYTGTESAKTRWLQFIWREIVIERPDQKPTRLDQPITTTGGTYRLTTDPATPSYNTDSGSASSPFYEKGFVSVRTADSTTMYDAPYSAFDKVAPLFAGAGAKPSQVISRTHFITYLVRGMDVLYRVGTDIELVSWTRRSRLRR